MDRRGGAWGDFRPGVRVSRCYGRNVSPKNRLLEDDPRLGITLSGGGASYRAATQRPVDRQIDVPEVRLVSV